MQLISVARNRLGIIIARRLVPSRFCIISDDCWGGQLYRQLKIPYLTPTVGLFIKPSDYLRYIEEFDLIHQEDLKFIKTDKTYPVATLSGVEIHFMHYKSEEEARRKYLKRYDRAKNIKKFIKIDFGKPGLLFRAFRNGTICVSRILWHSSQL